MRSDGIALVAFHELFGDEALWDELRRHIGEFTAYTEANLTELQARQKKKSYLIRRFLKSGRPFTLDDPWLQFGLSNRVLDIVNAYRGERTLLIDVDNWYTIPDPEAEDRDRVTALAPRPVGQPHRQGLHLLLGRGRGRGAVRVPARDARGRPERAPLAVGGRRRLRQARPLPAPGRVRGEGARRAAVLTCTGPPGTWSSPTRAASIAAVGRARSRRFSPTPRTCRRSSGWSRASRSTGRPATGSRPRRSSPFPGRARVAESPRLRSPSRLRPARGRGARLGAFAELLLEQREPLGEHGVLVCSFEITVE